MMGDTVEIDRDRLVFEAFRWLSCFTSGEMTDDEASGLAEWRAQSAAHDIAFRRLAGLHAPACMMRRVSRTFINRRALLTRAVIAGAAVVTFALGWSSSGFVRAPSTAQVPGHHSRL